MDINSFRKVIKQREETDDEWDYGIEQCWNKYNNSREMKVYQLIFSPTGGTRRVSASLTAGSIYD